MANLRRGRTIGALASRVQQLLALLLVFLGVLWMMLGPEPIDAVEAFIGPTLIAMGAVWLVGVRVLSWWHRNR